MTELTHLVYWFGRKPPTILEPARQQLPQHRLVSLPVLIVYISGPFREAWIERVGTV